MRDLLGRLYSGENDVDFLGKRKAVGIATLVIMVIAGGAVFFRGFNLSIEFEGGVVWEVAAAEGVTVDDVRTAVTAQGVPGARIQIVTSGGDEFFLIKGESKDAAAQDQVIDAIAELNGVGRNDVSREEVSASWGDNVTAKAQTALIYFFVLISLYIAIRFEWKMSVAAILAVAHDILVTVGVYAVLQFEVTPGTVIAFLTIMGYSLYDTIVVFDRVMGNTRAMTMRGKATYSEVVNVSLNQVVMRSINTTITSLLPVISMLLVGSFILGARTLEEFAVALLIGMLAGSYSSLFVATPILVMLKEREPRFKAAALRAKRASRSESGTATIGDIDVVNPMHTGQPPRPRTRRG